MVKESFVKLRIVSIAILSTLPWALIPIKHQFPSLVIAIILYATGLIIIAFALAPRPPTTSIDPIPEHVDPDIFMQGIFRQQCARLISPRTRHLVKILEFLLGVVILVGLVALIAS